MAASSDGQEQGAGGLMRADGPLFDRALLRRWFRVALFVGLLVLFRGLALLLISFVIFSRLLGAMAQGISRRFGMRRRGAVLVSTLAVLLVLGGSVAFGVVRAVATYLTLRSSLPERVAAFRQTPLYARALSYLPSTERIVEEAQHYAGQAVTWLAALGHVVIYLLIGFLLAVIFLLEEEELGRFYRGLPPRSLFGTLLRWLGYVSDAILVTLQFQLVVAAINAVLTMPVLLLVGIAHVTALTFMIFVSGVVPVVGNFVAGGVLAVLAYQARGWLGVALFLVLTFVLHKLESYYLNPRLAARHVRLPGFVLVVSLILAEKLLGFVGLFVSFPFLYVASRIQYEFRDEDAVAPLLRSQVGA